MEIDVDGPPLPDKLITVLGLAAPVATIKLPDTLPVLEGEKVTVKLTLSPASKMVPAGRPLAPKPGPDTLTFEIAMTSLLLFVRVTSRALLLPTFTSPESTFETLPNGPAPKLSELDCCFFAGGFAQRHYTRRVNSKMQRLH